MKLQSIRGMNDLLPEDSPVWQYVESTIANVVARYGYSEIRFPVLEKTELFKRSIGEVTDIVEKEMYTFEDRNGDSLTLRPEGTAGCVRAVTQHSLAHAQPQRLWYYGPMFRHERPQAGRLRQFHQVGVEAFGIASADIDAELLLLTHRLWRELHLLDAVTLEINSLGTAADRIKYKEALVRYLTEHRDKLDEDSQRRLGSNPLRILDSKNPQTQALLNDAPCLSEFIDDESKQHFQQLTALLDSNGVNYRINTRLVRGLDYYGKTVFEWVTDKLGAQGTICAGGRYDGLVEQLGGKPTPAIGFAMGVERLVLLLQALNMVPATLTKTVDVYLVAVGNVTENALSLAESIRSQIPTLRLQCHAGGGSFKSQMKKADKSGADIALILAEDEVAAQSVTLKYLRQEVPQQTVPQHQVCQYLTPIFTSN